MEASYQDERAECDGSRIFTVLGNISPQLTDLLHVWLDIFRTGYQAVQRFVQGIEYLDESHDLAKGPLLFPRSKHVVATSPIQFQHHHSIH